MEVICETCERPTSNDDRGAFFGFGYLCRVCGYYRLGAPKPPKAKKADLGASTSGSIALAMRDELVAWQQSQTEQVKKS